MLSLTSLDRSRHNERRGSDNEGLAGGGSMNLELVRVSDSKRSQAESEVTGNFHGHTSGLANGVVIHNGFESKKEHFEDLEANRIL